MKLIEIIFVLIFILKLFNGGHFQIHLPRVFPDWMMYFLLMLKPDGQSALRGGFSELQTAAAHGILH